MKTKSSIVGGAYLLSAAFLYALYGLFSRNISIFGAFSQNFVRGGIVFLVLLLYFLFNREKWVKFKKSDIRWFLIWVVPSSFQMVLIFLAFNHLPIGTSYYIIYSTMILGGFLSGKIFFSEKLSKSKLTSLFLVLVGLFLICGADLKLVTNVYVVMALLSGLIVGFWNTLTKKLSGNYSEFQMLLVDSFATFAVSFAGAKINAEILPEITLVTPWIWIVVFAFATIITTFLLIRGFKNLEAQVGSLILPMEVVFATFIGYLFLGEVLSVWTYLGGALIFVSAISPYLVKSRK